MCSNISRFYDGHNREVGGSTSTLASLLRPWIKHFTMIVSAGWNLISSKLKKSQAKLRRKTKTTPERFWIRPMYSASVAFS